MEEEIPRTVRELSKEAYLQWKHHPVTKAFHQFLRDFRLRLLDQHSQRWQANELLAGDGETEARTRVNMYEEIVTLEPEHILQFYGINQPEETDAIKDAGH